MRKPNTLIFLILLFFLINCTKISAQAWIDSCIQYTIHSDFDRAYAIIDSQLALDEHNYQAYFYRAATLNSMMTHFENDSGATEFSAAIDSAISILELLIEDTSGISPEQHAERLFYLGSAYGYLAFYQGRTGSYLPALSNGLESNSLLNLAVAFDSTYYDAYLGIGVFKYWRYSKLKFISWLPFIPDERDEGIAFIKKTISHSPRSKYMAMHQLVYILCDYGYPEQAIPYAQQIIDRYPQSQFMWWAAARSFDKSNDIPNAIHAYQQLIRLIQNDQNANPNHLYKCHLKLAEIYKRTADYQSCQDTCKNLLVLLDEIPVADLDDKRENIRDILNDCLERSEKAN